MSRKPQVNDIVKFVFRDKEHEAFINQLDHNTNELILTYIGTNTGPSKIKWNGTNWVFGRNILDVKFEAPPPPPILLPPIIPDLTTEEYTGKKFHQEPTTKFTTHQLADLEILIYADNATFDNLCSTNKHMHSLCMNKFYENQLYENRVRVHFPQYYEQVFPVAKDSVNPNLEARKRLTWKQIYLALKHLNTDVKNLKIQPITNLDWVTDEKLLLLRLFDAIQYPSSREYINSKVSFGNKKAWTYFIENYRIEENIPGEQPWDKEERIKNIGRLLTVENDLHLIDKFYEMNPWVNDVNQINPWLNREFTLLSTLLDHENSIIYDVDANKEDIASLLLKLNHKERTILMFNLIFKYQNDYPDKVLKLFENKRIYPHFHFSIQS